MTILRLIACALSITCSFLSAYLSPKKSTERMAWVCVAIWATGGLLDSIFDLID